MELINIYQCLCDRTRLRILNLLRDGPQCVCHLQTILREPQVKVSKHLHYLKARRMVEVSKAGNWRIYRLPKKRTRTLEANLRCLQDCVAEDPVFRTDLAKLAKLRGQLANDGPACAPHSGKTKTSAATRLSSSKSSLRPCIGQRRAACAG
jgi:ArsR family transcriptional regulator